MPRTPMQVLVALRADGDSARDVQFSVEKGPDDPQVSIVCGNRGRVSKRPPSRPRAEDVLLDWRP